jgi:DNA-binding beta-propeller fold protein YncE
MRRIALLVLFLTATSVFAQEASKVPDISFRLVNDFFQIPSDMVMAEAVGVALNSKGHIFILNRGTRPGQFNTPHNIVMDTNSNLYVADRQNDRLQVFDTDGKFKQEWRLDGPAWSLCITPGPRQVIFVGSVGRVYKLDLEGNVVGKFGKLGRLPGWFDSIHALACPDEKTLYIANEFSYRFDKVVLQ